MLLLFYFLQKMKTELSPNKLQAVELVLKYDQISNM